METPQNRFSVSTLLLATAMFAAFMGLARGCFSPAAVQVGLMFFAFWFPLVLFLLSRPIELDGGDPQSRTAPSLKFRLGAAYGTGMFISFLVMTVVENS